jgi:hypothetical protein
MTYRRIIGSAVLGTGLLLLANGGAEARILCDGNYQIVNGYPVSTPYCRDRYLGYVARTYYGWSISDEAIRYSESMKAQLCRAIGYDNRVQEACAPYRLDGSNRRVF